MANAGLPPGWTSHQAPDGRWYYAHQSGMTQWHHPSAGNAAPYAPPSNQHNTYSNAPQNSAVSGGLPMSAAARPFIPQSPVEFKMKEKVFSLSGDSFSVTRVDTGQPAFQVKGKALSLKDSKALLDMSGNAIYKMSESLFSLRGRMAITDAQTKQPVVNLRKKGFIPGFGTKTIQAWPGDKEDGPPYLEVQGDFFRRDFKIVEKASGRSLATIRRKSLNMANLLLEKDSYVIRVEPGVDAALMVFFVVAADEQYRDDGKRSGLF